jgi:DNA-binding response OmpR family regulator
MLIQPICTSPQQDAAFEEAHKVMIVDDDKNMFHSLRYALSSCGFHVLLCENATEALLCSVVEEFDYIVMEYEMPGMDGLELLRRLREQLPRAVIIGMGEKDMGQTFLLSGANDFLQKPFIPYRLAMMLDGGDILA